MRGVAEGAEPGFKASSWSDPGEGIPDGTASDLALNSPNSAVRNRSSRQMTI